MGELIVEILQKTWILGSLFSSTTPGTCSPSAVKGWVSIGASNGISQLHDRFLPGNVLNVLVFFFVSILPGVMTDFDESDWLKL